MPQNSRRRNTIIIILVVSVILATILLARCRQPESAVPAGATDPVPVSSGLTPEPAAPSTVAPSVNEPEEVLTPAVLQAPAQVSAGAGFSVIWTGPNNPRDYLTLVRKEAPDDAFASYRDTRQGTTLEFTAPIETGEWEMRYVAGRSRAVLGRAPLTVTPIEAALDAASEVIMGSNLSVSWTGPNNAGDYITIVLRGTPDGKYGNYTETKEGSPLTITAPTIPGDAELRYMTGQGGKVIGRRPLRILVPEVSLSAPDSAVAGSTLEVNWIGPNNSRDYITLVDRDRPDGQYGNYTYTSSGSPLTLLVPIIPGDAELRYMTGQGARVLARRAITLLAVEATLVAPAEAPAGTPIPITWTGPNYGGDYITVVPMSTPDGEYRNYANTNAGSPLNLNGPNTAGDCEIRYMTGQGAKVIARRPIRIIP